MADTTPQGAPLEIDSGMRLLLTSADQTQQYAIVYAPPDQDPPPGFESGYVYYYVTDAISRGSTELKVDAQPNCNDPGFEARRAVFTRSVRLTQQSAPPPKSATLWVDGARPTWAFDWQLTGTGTNVTGSVTWWRTSRQLLSLGSGAYSVFNNTAVDRDVTYAGTDTLTAR
ncbi:Hypothetical protein A7982_00790 [Minicystis rosea]|nr:Hypothetical protein A7982_00790 [Minicystis rosea]